MALLLVTATQEELLALFSKRHTPDEPALQELRKEAVSPLLFSVPRGLLTRKDVYACVTGVGPLNAALATSHAVTCLLHEKLPLEAVVNVGLAGSFDLASYPLASLVLVTEEIWPEYGLNDGHQVVAQAFKWPQYTPDSGKPVYDRIPLSDLSSLPVPLRNSRMCTIATSLTVAGVSASFERMAFLWNQYHAPLENMEGFAVAFTCLRFSVPVMEFRAISNKVGPRTSEEKDFPGALQALGDLLPALALM